jgi:hypothetical protein
MQEPKVAKSTNNGILISPLSAAIYAAGGTTISEGKGMAELSIAIKIVIFK